MVQKIIGITTANTIPAMSIPLPFGLDCPLPIFTRSIIPVIRAAREAPGINENIPHTREATARPLALFCATLPFIIFSFRVFCVIKKFLIYYQIIVKSKKLKYL
jgi:hypothetical protein